jgi:hypothetical protein
MARLSAEHPGAYKMSDSMASLPPNESADKSDAAQSHRWRFQFSLRSLLLFILIVALILTSVLMYRRMSEAEQELVKLRKIAGYYKVEDKNLLYAIAIETNELLSWRWRVYLPAGHKYTWHYYSGNIPDYNDMPKSSGNFGDAASRTYGEEEIIYLALRKDLDNHWVLILMQELNGVKTSAFFPVSEDIVDQIRKARGADWHCIGNGKDESRKLNGPIIFLKYRISEILPTGSSIPSDNRRPGIMLWLEAEP